MRRARFQRDPDGLEGALRKHVTALHDVQEVLGEAVVSADFCQTVYEIACQLPDVEIVPELTDHVGRAGRGVAGVQFGERIELVFCQRLHRTAVSQWFLAEPQPFGPQGTLHSWSAFLERAVVERLPPDTPPVPRLPCEPPGRGPRVYDPPGLHRVHRVRK